MTNVGGLLARGKVWIGLLVGQGAKRMTKKCTRVAGRASPEVKVTPRQLDGFLPLFDTLQAPKQSTLRNSCGSFHDDASNRLTYEVFGLVD
jgi:hypothetical protein